MDSLHWHYEQHDRFTVRNAFWNACREAQGRSVGPGESSTSSAVSLNFIRSARVPPKVHVSAWRVCRNGLPTTLNLESKGVVTNDTCPWCGSENEDLLHTLLRCLFPRQVWALSNLHRSIISQDTKDTKVWLRGLRGLLDTDDFGKALLTCWFLWWARNGFIFKTSESQLEK
ncbi:UNVERIFIED_CONTAM: hypothetical protein Slati_3692100 [Sesamum latifolium]|uniref:Reverse transcriptase zinc-binding domain-containing protein n=1 Tax=Sesamum latifolium TaxID=2727402 RepID=A0AAW2U1N7_9LAMI